MDEDLTLAKSLNRLRPIHFIGIGGIGMSALALIFENKGHQISGSDTRKNKNIQKLLDKGVTIYNSQIASNIKCVLKEARLPPLIVISTAIPKNNAELQAAIQEKLEIWHRSDLLASLMEEQSSIAVAGSHGKTTTSSLIATLLAVAKKDPTAVIGGVVPYWGTNGHAGEGKLLVAEADESDGSLTKLNAELGVLTNIELDHTDHYENISEIIKIMKKFSKQCKQLISNYDCPVVRENFKDSIFYSTETHIGVSYAALPVKLEGDKTMAEIYENNKSLGKITIPIPGKHNLNNMIAAIAACRIEGLSFEEIKKGLEYIQTPKRRFDFQGVWQERLIYDDYAHHPSEVKATIEIGRLMLNSSTTPLPGRPERILIVFQPHRYTRTQEFLERFAKELGKADSIILAPIFAAGENPIEGLTSHSLEKEIKILYPNLPIFTANTLNETSLLVKKHSLKNDLIISMGAGNINTLWELLCKEKQSTYWNSKLAA